jgi:hypothetical protein
MTTTWQILDAVRLTSNGLVKKLVYKCEVQLEDIIGEKKGKIILQESYPNPNFIPFQDLTEEILLEWVKTSLGTEQVTIIEITLQDKVSTLYSSEKIKKTQKGLPWSL